MQQYFQFSILIINSTQTYIHNYKETCSEYCILVTVSTQLHHSKMYREEESTGEERRRECQCQRPAYWTCLESARLLRCFQMVPTMHISDTTLINATREKAAGEYYHINDHMVRVRGIYRLFPSIADPSHAGKGSGLLQIRRAFCSGRPQK